MNLAPHSFSLRQLQYAVAVASSLSFREAAARCRVSQHCFGQQALAVCTSAKARELEFRATSLSTIAHMVASGAGVTLLPELSVSTEARLPELRVRCFRNPAPARTIGMVWRKRSALAAALREVAATVRGAYPDSRYAPPATSKRAQARSERSSIRVVEPRSR